VEPLQKHRLKSYPVATITWNAAVSRILSILPDSASATRITTDAAVTSITDGTGTRTNITTGSSVLFVGGTGDRFRGTGSTISPTADGAFLNNNATEAVANVNTVRILFPQTITDNDTFSDIFFSEIGTDVQSGDGFLNIRAIIGGTLANPTYGGQTFLNGTSYATDTRGFGFSSLRNVVGNSNTNFDFRGFGLDLSEHLGVTSIIGIEFGGGTDPNFVMAVVPEPSAALLGALGCLALLRRRRA